MYFLCLAEIIIFNSYNSCFSCVIMIYSPTKLPDAANATDITQADLRGIICTLFPVYVSHIISFPSNEPVTQCLPSPLYATEFTLLRWPFISFLTTSLGFEMSETPLQALSRVTSACFCCASC